MSEPDNGYCSTPATPTRVSGAGMNKPNRSFSNNNTGKENGNNLNLPVKKLRLRNSKRDNKAEDISADMVEEMNERPPSKTIIKLSEKRNESIAKNEADLFKLPNDFGTPKKRSRPKKL